MNVTDIFYSILEETQESAKKYRKWTFEEKQPKNGEKIEKIEEKTVKKRENFYFFDQKPQKTEKKLEIFEENPLDGVIKGNVWFELFYKNGTTKHIRHSTAENLEYYLQRLNKLYGRTEIPIKIEILK